ncbi:cellulose biosynthesis protein BcsF [Pseudomonas ogarae]|uniref:cellulose biosynthesis protein BcsF n=1 Tax=Pseudomonas ogarae (strain DSM 112162 / CECT 30235 / F113) TaxID=1114970 RepID=UPI00194FA912
MNLFELFQLIAVSSLLTLACVWLLRSVWRQGQALLQSLLPPRYLKPRRLPRRASTSVIPEAPHE